MRMPKGISNHPSVKICLSGDNEGFDYKYNVELKEGFVFGNGRNAGSNMMNFHTVRDFKDITIIKAE